eukprot:CAMPEP_0172156820 /NCGR_PEP_ID=MMETSP1050-20130122/3440_1 /TAXON_ID=233186 /ORGANISM="Cryptomonas curvata, Strain CCAP979/52" /LENGTH=200 /DNA_ID=CAMNT_0012825965 /DNA_START=181 /DNA_END=780 /DNA_ORIENTATION=+
MSQPSKFINLDAFARRQWKSDYKGLVIKGMSEDDLEAKVNELYHANPSGLKDGYAPFCKHLFVPCFLPDATVEAVPITPENRHLLRSDYEARKPEELPVLVRWFPKETVAAPAATYLDLILYSREQLIKENEAMGGPAGAADDAAPWGLISIKPQTVDYEIPMQPITMMRNALGKDQGGSGVTLDAAKYRDSVRYWAAHA